jgi:hypothetical protein
MSFRHFFFFTPLLRGYILVIDSLKATLKVFQNPHQHQLFTNQISKMSDTKSTSLSSLNKSITKNNTLF